MARHPRLWGRHSHRIRLVALAACLGLICAGVALAVFSPGGSKPGRLASDASRAPVSTETGTAATQGPSARAASSARGQPINTKPAKVTAHKGSNSVLTWPPRLSRQILRWEAGPGGASLARVEAQLGTAMQTAGLKLYVTMKNACGALASNTRTAQAGPPIPDRAIQRSYGQALAGLYSAASDCQAAISIHATGDETTETRLDSALLSRARAEFALMSSHLYRATAQISSLHR